MDELKQFWFWIIALLGGAAAFLMQRALARIDKDRDEHSRRIAALELNKVSVAEHDKKLTEMKADILSQIQHMDKRFDRFEEKLDRLLFRSDQKGD